MRASRRTPWARTVARASGVVVAPLACALVVGCVDYDFVEVECPPIEDFAAVSPLLESRCGTLDCHGSVSRPLRIYGQYGLRLDPTGESDGLYAGNLGQPTSQLEIEANYRTVCGLEPEKMTRVARGELEPTALTMVRKPRLAEKHKGGRIWDQGKEPDRCLVTWLQAEYDPGEMDPSDCRAATEQ